MKSIFLSDLHIGVDAPTNLYQTSKHQPSLKAILKYIQENGKNIRDVVILGDWIDLWMYNSTARPMTEMPTDRATILPTVKQIIEANPGVFKNNNDNTGDFISCINSIQGNFYYVSGNHDMNYYKDPSDPKDPCDPYDSISYLIDYFKKNTKKGITWIDCSKEKNDVYKSSEGEIYAEHGHWYSMLCKPKSDYLYENKLPFGYFVTRAGMDAIQSTPALTIENIKGKMNGTPKLTFSAALLQILAEQAGKQSWKDFNFILPKGYDPVSVNDIVTKCFTFPPSAVDNPEFVVVDNEGNLDGIAREFFTKDDGLKIVLMGHTHDAKQFQDFSVICNDGVRNQATYVNTGFLCVGAPNGNTGLPVATFVEIEDTGIDSAILAQLPYKINMKYVNFATATVSDTPLCKLNVVDLGNIALNKPVVASSVERNDVKFAASNAVDGNNSTRWSSASCTTTETLPPQWIYVDLMQDYTIDKVVLSWEYAYAKKYSISISNDEKNWTEVYSNDSGKGYVENIQLSKPVKARYVRMYGKERGLNPNPQRVPAVHGYSLYEFEVYASYSASTTTTRTLFPMEQ